MAEGFKLPRVRAADTITDKDGKAANVFVRFWDTVTKTIERQENGQNQTIADIQQLVAQLQQVSAQAQAAAQAANAAQAAAYDPTVKAGSATGASDVGASWSAGAQVNLTGVIAGTLTLAGSGPIQTNSVETDSARAIFGEWRVVEVVGGVETVVFTGQFAATKTSSNPAETPSINNTSATAAQEFSLAQSSTGAVSYRLDVRRTSTSGSIFNLGCYLFVRRAA